MDSFSAIKMLCVGGGNTAFEEAIYLSNLCNKVYLIHRREGVRADQVLQRRVDRLVDEGKIVKQFNCTQ